MFLVTVTEFRNTATVPFSFSCRLEQDDTSSAESREMSNMKRHSDGTFANDYSKFLEDRKAQDFVRWLMSNKRSGLV